MKHWFGTLFTIIILFHSLPSLHAASYLYLVSTASRSIVDPQPAGGYSQLFVLNGTHVPTITVTVGDIITFQGDIPTIHHFYLTTESAGGGGGALTTSITGSQSLEYTVPNGLPDIIYYGCTVSFHQFMGGQINVQAPPPPVHVTLLHFNDVYELIPFSGRGGLSRVATLRKQLLQSNPNTYTLFAGDLLSPSALSTVKVPLPTGVNATLDGMHMIAAMNALKVDYATFGNHDNDLKPPSFYNRMNESHFKWLSTNANNISYPNVQRSALFTTAADDFGSTINIGIVGLTIDTNVQWYESFANFSYSEQLAAQEIANLQSQQSDIIIGLTHWDVSTDISLITNVPGFNIITGGHEHIPVAVENYSVPIYKAHSNAENVWVHDLYIDKSYPTTSPHYFTHSSRLVQINDTLGDDDSVDNVISLYYDLVFQYFPAFGFTPRDDLCYLTVPLDFDNQVVRTQRNTATDSFGRALLVTAIETAVRLGHPELVVDFQWYNSGSFRLDDTFENGTTLSEYDVLRVVPFANVHLIMNISGDWVKRTLDSNFQTQYAKSQWLQFYPNITYTIINETVYTYYINGVELDENRWYLAACTNFLCTTGPAPYTWLNPTAHPDKIQVVLTPDPTDLYQDARYAWKRVLAAQYPIPPINAAFQQPMYILTWTMLGLLSWLIPRWTM